MEMQFPSRQGNLGRTFVKYLAFERVKFSTTASTELLCHILAVATISAVVMGKYKKQSFTWWSFITRLIIIKSCLIFEIFRWISCKGRGACGVAEELEWKREGINWREEGKGYYKLMVQQFRLHFQDFSILVQVVNSPVCCTGLFHFRTGGQQSCTRQLHGHILLVFYVFNKLGQY